MKRKNILLIIFLISFLFTGCSSLPDTIFPKPGNGDIDFKPTQKISYEHLVDGVDFKSGEVLVRLVVNSPMEDTLFSLGSQIIEYYKEIGWALVSVPAGKTTKEYIKELENQDVVIMATPNQRRDSTKQDFDWRNLTEASLTPDAEYYAKLWGIKKVKADKAWQITTGSPQVIVALLGSGLDLTHPEFINQEILEPYNSTNDSSVIGDVTGEGTCMAGVVAADGRTEKLAGVVWDCPIMPIQIIEDNGLLAESYIVKGILKVVNFVIENPEYRAVIVTGLYNWNYSNIVKDAIDYGFENGVLLVAGSGDNGKLTINYPSAYNGVISVSGSTPYDKIADGAAASYWNSIAAPCVEIWSSQPASFGSYYDMSYGTGLAAAYVSGAIAMLLSHNPQLESLQILNQIEETARPGYYGEGFNEKLGYGILDCEALLGNLKPLKYASIRVQTDAFYDRDKAYYDYGMVTVFAENGKMAYFGATGADGSHNFYAVLPGTYTITLSYQGEIHDQIKFTIGKGEKRNIPLTLKK